MKVSCTVPTGMGWATTPSTRTLSVTASTEQKFELQNRIEECQREINRLEGTLNLSLKLGWVLRKDLKGQE